MVFESLDTLKDKNEFNNILKTEKPNKLNKLRKFWKTKSLYNRSYWI